jgi:uncharacterized membrane protein YqgA involved in biofilm formation
MLGPVVNAITVVGCSLAGKLLIRNIPERIAETIMKAVGLAVIYLGISGATQNQSVLILLCSLLVGTAIGELVNIDKGMVNLGNWVENRVRLGEGDFSKGFVTASIVFCVGSMAIVGALESGLTGSHQTLFAKSVIDGITSIVFASQMGLGVMFAAVPVLLYEGGIALGAAAVKDWLTAEIITEMSAVGCLLIAAIGFNFLEVKEIKVANMIPAIFLPWLFIAVRDLIF